MKVKKNQLLIKKVFDYFAIFDYFPSFEDVYTFFPKKISKDQLKTVYKEYKYTVGEYSKDKIKNQKLKIKISQKKLNNLRFRVYIRLISLFPQIKLVGLSGSISMMNAKDDDDIDLFIITAENRLFTGRLIALFLVQLLGLRRRRGLVKQFKDKICLNLFFDESNLKVPKFKQTLFVGHEVLQMKPIINKNCTYEKFLSANKWVLLFFPNASQILNLKKYKSNFFINRKSKNLGDRLENRLKNLQLKLINQHKTTEIITSDQLWFHPDDFAKKIFFNQFKKF